YNPTSVQKLELARNAKSGSGESPTLTVKKNSGVLSVNARHRRTCSGRLTTVTFSTLTRSRPWLPCNARPVWSTGETRETQSLWRDRRMHMAIPLQEFGE